VENVIGSEEALRLKMKMRMAINEKSDPLNGLPSIHAKTATDKRGGQINIPSNLFDGFHFAIKNARRM
jgi:hypothetical protein